MIKMKEAALSECCLRFMSAIEYYYTVIFPELLEMLKDFLKFFVPFLADVIL